MSPVKAEHTPRVTQVATPTYQFSDEQLDHVLARTGFPVVILDLERATAARYAEGMKVLDEDERSTPSTR